MPTLYVNVKDKIATGDNQIVVCNNKDYVVHFTFDSEWNEYNQKTMRVVFSNGEYYESEFEGSECALPIIQNKLGFKVGVYAGDLHTTAGAFFDCIKSIVEIGDKEIGSISKEYQKLLSEHWGE